METSKIMLVFPKDDTLSQLDNLGLCETAPLFTDLKEVNKKFNAMRKHVVIHKLKFNLNDLLQYTNNITETVTVYADTVYMTEPMNITYKLNIRTRVASISHPISMFFNRTEKELPKMDGIEVKYINFSSGFLMMRQRTFGLVDIIDKHDIVPTSSKCQPLVVESSNKNIDVGEWFDTTIVNMMNVCGHALLGQNSEYLLARKMIDFILAFHRRKTDFKDETKYSRALKFQDFNKLQVRKRIHFVPNYNFQDIHSLSDSLKDQFALLSSIVKKHEEHICDVNSRLGESNQIFAMIEMVMTNLFNTEKNLFLNSLQSANISILTSSKASQER